MTTPRAKALASTAGAVLAILCAAAPAMAQDAVADPASAASEAALEAAQARPPIETSFRVMLRSDYVSRGVTSTEGHPAIQSYGEMRFASGVYLGIMASNVSYPEEMGLSDPTAEVNFTAGMRYPIGRTLLDFGAYHSWYPGEKAGADTDSSGLFVMARHPLRPDMSLNGSVFWTPDRGGTGVDSTYLAVGASRDLPFALSPGDRSWIATEVGHQIVGRYMGMDQPDHTAWKTGIGYQHRNMTWELNYSHSDLSDGNCVYSSGNPGWCGRRLIFGFSIDLK